MSFQKAGTPMARRRLRIVMAAVAAPLTLLLAFSAVPGSARAATSSTFLASKPYVRMFTQVEATDCDQIKRINNLTGTALSTALAQIRSWYVQANAQGANVFWLGKDCKGASPTTLAAKLAATGMVVSQYRNGTDTSQSFKGGINFREAAGVEAAAPLAILTFWPGNAGVTGGSDTDPSARLVAPLDAGDTTVTLTSPAARRPATTAPSWPYMNSRGTGLGVQVHSANTHDFVSWVRVDNELMQVIAEPVVGGGNVTLTVRRGLWGTGAAAHAAQARVLSPVYVGVGLDPPADSTLIGTPVQDDTQWPLRYSLKIWDSAGYGWIAARTKAMLAPAFQGYNGIWWDISSCTLYNHADAVGGAVVPWNDLAATKMTPLAWGQFQQRKFEGLAADLPGIKMIANTVGQSSDCTTAILSQSVDYGVFESWMNYTRGFVWQTPMIKLFKVMANDWPALLWVRWDVGAFTGDPSQYKRFSYGSMLLTWRPTSTKAAYGGPFRLSKPDELYFWNWGAPATQTTGLADIRVAGTTVFRRDFANGIVVVNPTASPVTYALGGTYFDVANKVNGSPAPVTSLTLKAHDAAFLLRSRG